MRRALLAASLALGAVGCGKARQASPEHGPAYRRLWQAGACKGHPVYEGLGCVDGVFPGRRSLDDAELLAEEMTTLHHDYPSRLEALRAYAKRHGASTGSFLGAAMVYSAHGQHDEAMALLDKVEQHEPIDERAYPAQIALRAGRCDLALRFRLRWMENPGTCMGTYERQCDAMTQCQAFPASLPLLDGDPPFPPYRELVGADDPQPSPEVGAPAPHRAPAAAPAIFPPGAPFPAAGSWARRLRTAEAPIAMAPGGRPLAIEADGTIALLSGKIGYPSLTFPVEAAGAIVTSLRKSWIGVASSRVHLLRFAPDGSPLERTAEESVWFAYGLARDGASLWLSVPAEYERRGGFRGKQDVQPDSASLMLRSPSGDERWRYTIRTANDLIDFPMIPTLAAVATNRAGEVAVAVEPGTLVSLLPDGRLKWSQSIKGRADLSDVAIDDAGSVVVAGGGGFKISIDGEPIPCPGAPWLVEGGFFWKSEGGFWIAALDAAGRHVWSRCASALANASMVAVDASGAVTVAGTFRKRLDLGAGPLVALGKEDAFVARFSRDGKLLWSQRLGAPGRDADPTELDDVTALAADAEGGSAVALRLNWVEDQRLLGAALVARLDASGKLRWTRFYPGAPASGRADHRHDPIVHGVAIDPRGGVVLAGVSLPALSIEGVSLGEGAPGESATFLARIGP